MSLRIRAKQDTWDWKNVYISYDGNEELYDYVSSNTRPIVKMIVSRGYSVNLDTNKVDRLNDALYNFKEVILISRVIAIILDQ